LPVCATARDSGRLAAAPARKLRLRISGLL
jgi:hypothetical protein